MAWQRWQAERCPSCGTHPADGPLWHVEETACLACSAVHRHRKAAEGRPHDPAIHQLVAPGPPPRD